MISINLLPREFRKAEPTPWPRLLALFCSLAFVLAVGLVYVYYHFNLLPVIRQHEKELADESKMLKERAAEADRLRAEISDFERRERTILEIRQTRYLWAKKLDQLLDVIPTDMWLTALRAEEARGAARTDTASGPKIQMDCLLLGSDKSQIADFRRGVMNHPIYNDVQEFPEFAWSVVLAGDPSSPESQAMRFQAILVLKRKEVTQGAAPKKPSAGATARKGS